MTVDVATLVFEFKSDSAKTAEDRMDALITKGERLEAVAKRVRTATDRVNEGHRGAAGAVERSAQANMALAGSEGAVERATRAAGRASAEVRAQRQLEAAAMRELSVATRAYERDLAKTAAAVDALRASVNPLGAAVARTNAEIAEANRLHSIGAIDAKEHAAAVSTLTARLHSLDEVNVRSAGSMRVAQRAGVDLSRQFADIGVTAAMGMNPLMIFIQQGPQIVDTMAMMKAEGVGVGAAFKQMGTFVGGAVAGLGPLVAVVVALGGAFALFHRELAKGYPDDITKGLGLTEEQLDRVKHKTVTFGDTLKATFNVLGRYIMESPLGDAFKWMGAEWDRTLDQMTAGAFDATTNMIAFFTASYKTIVANWSNLPGAMGVILANTVNAMNRALEWFINGNAELVNKFQRMWGKVTNTQPIQIPTMKLPTYDPGKFGGKDIAADFQKDFEADRAAFQAMGRGFVRDVRKEALKIATARAVKEAGDANKGAGGPRDMNDERLAQLNEQLARAKAAELQAQLALATDVTARAAIENKILDMEVLAQAAAIEKQRADIADQATRKQITEATARELNAKLDEIAQVEASTAELKRQAIERAKVNEINRNAHAVRMGELDLQIELKEGAASLLKSTFARNLAERDILDLRKEQERIDLTEIKQRGVLGGYTVEQVERAKSRLAVLDQLYASEQEQLSQQTRLVDAIGEAADAARGFKNAFRSRDFAGAIDNLLVMIQTVRSAGNAHGFTGGLVSAAGAAAPMIGGRVGSALTNGLGAFTLASSMPAISGALGLTGTALGGLAAIAGPIGIAAAALTMLVPLLSGKPTNAGAGYDLRTGAVSGNRRTAETEDAARSAGDAIKAIETALKSAGVSLTDSVTGLVIGTRDQTQIYLESGKELRSAIGDSEAAVATAMRALLDGATYASEAQEKVAKAALAAGGGFEAVIEALTKFEQAQAISGSLADRILQLKSEAGGQPDYELEMFRRGIAEERKAYQGMADEGFLTAEKLAGIFAQLSEIESLGVAAIMKQFADAVTSSTELLKQRRSMEAELLRLQGDEVGARAVERALALAELDAGLHELQKQIWNTADALAAAAIMNQGRSMTAELLRIQGFEEQATAIERALALEGLPEALRALQVDIWRAGDAAAATTKHFEALDAALTAANDNLSAAQDQVREAYEREAGAIRDHVDEMEAAARSLRDFRRELDVGSLAGRDPLSQYARTKAEFDRLNAMAANDPQRLANLQSVSQAFLEASRAASPTQMAFDRDLNAVRRATEASELAAQKEVDVGRAQLEALTTQVSQLMQLNATAMTVAQSLSFLKDALVQQAVAQAASAGNPYGTAANDNAFDPARYLAGNKDIVRYALANGLDPVEFARQHWLTAGQYEVAAGLRGYATGGSFMVGGSGGTDSQLVQFMASPDERVDILTPAQQRGGDDGELAAELREQNRLLAEQNALLRRIDHSTDQTQSKLKDFDQGGLWVRGKAPDDPVETQEAPDDPVETQEAA